MPRMALANPFERNCLPWGRESPVGRANSKGLNPTESEIQSKHLVKEWKPSHTHPDQSSSSQLILSLFFSSSECLFLTERP